MRGFCVQTEKQIACRTGKGNKTLRLRLVVRTHEKEQHRREVQDTNHTVYKNVCVYLYVCGGGVLS